jgi:hypothetical protein
MSAALRAARRARRFLGRWLLITLGLSPFACAARCVHFQSLARSSSGRELHLESTPRGAAIVVDDEPFESPTPSAVDVDWPPRREGGHVEVRLGGAASQAAVSTTQHARHGKHDWPGDHLTALAPELDGSIWVQRATDVFHVWLPQPGRARVAVQTTYFLNDASLDGVKHDVHDWDAASSSRWFDTSAGLDLAEGEHTIGGWGWRVRADLGESVGLYLVESRIDGDFGGRPADVAPETLVVTLAKERVRDGELAPDGEPPLRLEGGAPSFVETRHAVLRFVDPRGRHDTVEVTLENSIGLWLRVGASR